ncbi:MAG: methylmalonyl-CoA mutase, partial [Planctomycetes bacterium]|nr:methylmalonyl-CoA mutase [Planctomycetota bacterium]
GYHIREAGATAAQELGFTMANGIAYVEESMRRGLDADALGRRISFFFAAHSNFFEEIAKFRAARRLWAGIMRDRFGAKDPRAQMCRFHTQTGGVTLTAQQPYNNVVRVTLQALAALLGGTQSLHTNAMDEALALPTEASARLALRTQQILAHEIGIQDVADPFGGSAHLEAETERLETEARRIIDEIDRRGGATACIDYERAEIEKSAIAEQRAVEEGRKIVVGVNKYEEKGPSAPIRTLRIDPALHETRARQIEEFRRSRDASACRRAGEAIRRAADEGTNLMPPVLDAVKAGVTLGEICAALREKYGSQDAR